MPQFGLFAQLANAHSAMLRQWREKWGWTLPNLALITEIMDFAGGDPILEIGAGCGLVTALLTHQDATVRATDVQPPEETFTKVETLCAEDAVCAAPEPVLLICNPPAFPASILDSFPGDRVVYVGPACQGEGGDAERPLLDALRRDWSPTITKTTTFLGNEELWLCERRNNNG